MKSIFTEYYVDAGDNTTNASRSFIRLEEYRTFNSLCKKQKHKLIHKKDFYKNSSPGYYHFLVCKDKILLGTVFVDPLDYTYIKILQKLQKQ